MWSQVALKPKNPTCHLDCMTSSEVPSSSSILRTGDAPASYNRKETMDTIEK